MTVPWLNSHLECISVYFIAPHEELGSGKFGDRQFLKLQIFAFTWKDDPTNQGYKMPQLHAVVCTLAHALQSFATHKHRKDIFLYKVPL